MARFDAISRDAESRSPIIGAHVALSSIELSSLSLVAFDPEAELAVRQGGWVNVIDGDDSGVLRHVVPLAGYPEAAWRAVAAAMNHVDADHMPLEQVYRTRIVPPTRPPARFFRLHPWELATGLRKQHPDAFRERSAIAPRIHTLEALTGADSPWFFVEPKDFSQPALLAVAVTMMRKDEPVWGPDMLLQQRVVIDDASEERAWSSIAELQAALRITREAPFGAGLDFATYRNDMVRHLCADPVALRLLSDMVDLDLDIVRDALAAASLPSAC